MTISQGDIERLCKFAHGFSGMDTVFIDSSSKITCDYAISIIPEALKIYYSPVAASLKVKNSLEEARVFFHSTTYGTNYISSSLYSKDREYLGSILLGPYLLEEVDSPMIKEIIMENNLPLSLKDIVKQYYLSLPMVNTYKAKTIGEFLAYMTSTLPLKACEDLNIGEISYNMKEKPAIASSTIRLNNEQAMEIIERRYAAENSLLYAVETGNGELLEKSLLEEYPIMRKISDRIPNDPLRSRKNLAFVFSTLLRKAAEKGGVHPIYLDSISEKFSTQVEKCTTIAEIDKLNKEMCRCYCGTVQKLALKTYRPLIRKAIEYIRINLSEELSLDIISSALSISSYELSRQFKKETGKSIVEFINIMRISEAIHILELRKHSITEAAYMTGFNDVNYFSKVFKKIKGVTPSEFIKDML